MSGKHGPLLPAGNAQILPLNPTVVIIYFSGRNNLNNRAISVVFN